MVTRTRPLVSSLPLCTIESRIGQAGIDRELGLNHKAETVYSYEQVIPVSVHHPRPGGCKHFVWGCPRIFGIAYVRQVRAQFQKFCVLPRLGFRRRYRVQTQGVNSYHFAWRCPQSGLYSDTIPSLRPSQARFSPPSVRTNQYPLLSSNFAFISADSQIQLAPVH